MSSDQYEAAKKVWRIPELMDKFLSFLDSRSIVCLAQSRIGCTLNLLQHNSLAWSKLIRRTLPGDHKIERALSSVEYWSIVRDMYKEKKIKVGHLVDILRMMDDSTFPMLDLLEVICEKSPPDMGVPDDSGEAFDNYIIRLGCPQHPSHTVSPLGFLLLEEVEGGFSSAMQGVELVDMPRVFCPELVPALGSRVARQQGKMVEMRLADVHCSNSKSAEAMSTLLQNSDPGKLNIGELSLDNIGADGWALLAKAISTVPGCVLQIATARRHMKEGRREDLRTVWELIKGGWMILGVGTFFKNDGEEGWKALQQALDAMSDSYFERE